MTDLISRSAAIAELEEWTDDDTGDEFDRGYDFAMRRAIRVIKNISSVDTAVRGSWGEYERNPMAYSLSGFPCSVCGMHQDDIRGLYYCPNCGAQMDGDAE